MARKPGIVSLCNSIKAIKDRAEKEDDIDKLEELRDLLKPLVEDLDRVISEVTYKESIRESAIQTLIDCGVPYDGEDFYGIGEGY